MSSPSSLPSSKAKSIKNNNNNKNNDKKIIKAKTESETSVAASTEAVASSSSSATAATATATATVKIDGKLQQRWMLRYQQLKDFLKRNGHTNVPNNWAPNKPLSLWVKNQRTWFRQITNQNYELIKFDPVYQERIDLLNEIDFQWDRCTSQWALHYNNLKKFFQENGHTNVPKIWHPNEELVQWVSMQRQWYHLNTNEFGQLIRHNSYFQKRLDLLNALDFQWSSIKQHHVQQPLKKLQQQKQQQKHQQVIEATTPLNGYYKNDIYKTPSLYYNDHDKWMIYYKQLKEFHDNYGISNVPENCKPFEILGKWIKAQRLWYQQHTNEHGKLIEFNTNHQERIDLLNQIYFEWVPIHK